MRRVGRDAVAEQLGIDLRPARASPLELLEHDHRRRLAHDEAVALARRTDERRASGRRSAERSLASPRSRRSRRASRAPPCHRRSSRLRGRAGSRRARRRAPCSTPRRRCTPRASGPFVPSSIETQPAARFGMIWTIENGLTRSGPRWSSIWMQASNDFSPPIPVATAAPTRSGAAAMSRPASASACLAAAKREMREAVHPPRGLEVDVLRDFEILHLAGEVDREVRRVELRDLGRAGLTRDERGPRVLDGVAERAHHPETRHDDPASAVLGDVAHRATSPVRRPPGALRP